MCLALLTLCSCSKKCWLIEPLCYSILFSDDVTNDEVSEVQGALISTIFCKVDKIWSSDKCLFYVLSTPLRYVKRL